MNFWSEQVVFFWALVSVENFKLKSGISVLAELMVQSHILSFSSDFPSAWILDRKWFFLSQKKKKFKESMFFQYMHLVSSMCKEILFYLHPRKDNIL